ncbi:MAG: type II secretion system F family protein [Aeromicrobium sp.]|uniref:type II secretion system F family protein n=1 Tax=Aeromicrobium sp. TaxID=1871063 RepID=UPI0039E62407
MTTLAALFAALAAACALPPGADRRARRLFGPPRVRRELDHGVVAAGGLLVVATMVTGWPWGTLVAGLAAPVVRERVNRRRQAPVSGPGSEVSTALDLVAAALEAGRPPSAAVAAAAAALGGSVGAELDRMAARLLTAADPQTVWQDMAEHPELAPLGRAIVRAGRSGAAPAGVVAQVADDLRRQRQAELTRRSRSSGVSTAAPLGLCFLPAFFLVGVLPTLFGLIGDALGL